MLVVYPDTERRNETAQTTNILRERGFNVEMYHTPSKQSQQLRYASLKGIPYVWFLPYGAKGHEVKNMATGEKVAADPHTWNPT